MFGVDAEESGFDPTQARFDEVGVMYARTVFDPLTIILANGDWAPYLAQSVVPNASYTAWTITLRPNLVFHDGTPCNGAALVTNLVAQSKSLLTGIVLSPTLVSITQTGPLAATISFKAPWIPFPYYLAGGIGGQIAYVVAPSMLSNPNGTTHPVGTGPFVFKEWVPNDHFTATANPNYWRQGLPYLSQITYKPIPDEEARAEALKSGTIDLMITDTPQIITQLPRQQELLVHRRQHARGRRAGHELCPAQLPGQAVQQRQRPVGRRAGDQPPAVRPRDRRGRPAGEQRPVRAGLALLLDDAATRRTTRRSAKKLVSAAAKANGGPITFTYGSTNSPAALRAAQYLEQAWKAVGFKVSHEHRPAEPDDQQRPGRQVRGPRAGASSAPSIRTSTTSSGARPP